MTGSTTPTLDIALAYFEAWTSHDVDAATRYLADDITCHAPSGQIDGITAFRQFMEPFSTLVTGASVIAAFGDESTAMIMYDTETIPVASAPAAEVVTVEDGRITRLHIIFDRLPFEAAQRTAVTS